MLYQLSYLAAERQGTDERSAAAEPLDGHRDPPQRQPDRQPNGEVEAEADRPHHQRDRPRLAALEVAQEADVQEAGRGEQAGEDREGEAGQQRGQAGAEAERQHEQRDAHHQRRAAGAGPEALVRGQSAGAVADRHPGDAAGEEVGGSEAHRQAPGPDALGLLAEVAAGRVGGGQAGVGEGQRELGDHEGDQGRGEDRRVELGKGDRRGAELEVAPGPGEGDGQAEENEHERDQVPPQREGGAEHHEGESDQDDRAAIDGVSI